MKLSDRELFERMPLNDPWLDGDMTSVFTYLMNHEKTVIPDTWLSTMNRFQQQLLQETTCDPTLLDQYNSLIANTSG